ncbi:MAG: indolepyruvate ferredoxin oxidoreductase family protein, partial [Pseudomonadota bacterium]
MDALKHANAAGVSRYGGVVAVAGDDHGAFSSSLAHQSDHMFIGAAIPILYPATLQDVVDFGVYGWAMSRFTGCWIGLKLVSEVAETSRVIEVSRDRHVFASPSPAPDVQIRWPDPPLGMEQRLLQARLPAVAAFSSANPIDKIEWKTPSSELGVIAAGKTYLDIREALNLLGIGERQARRLGLAIYKPGLIWPLNTSKLHDFTSGLRALYVIEEKRPVLWDQVITSLYGRASAPDVVGAASAGGPWATPDCGVLNPTTLAQQIGRWLLSHAPDQEELRRRLADIATRTAGPAQDETPPPPRLPFYCAGCPHNTGTSVPEGATAMAGIGCHGMAAWIPSRNIESMTHMGGEGMHWLGRAPFTEKRHIFQNVGDGTYAHSASLNIRAAVAAGANITFKILYNEAVAMTGGQPVEAGLSVAQICELVQAEDVAKVCVVTDDMERFRDGLPAGVRLAPRTELEIIQRDLQETQGVSVLVYAQGCAAEKRRKRKRGLVEDPAVRVMINEMVCEGCGDCGRKSNCVAIQPLETEYGRKRTINQSACNKDVSCVRGFCPSFITIEGGVYTPARQALDESWRSGLPLPASLDLRGVANIAMAGVGGTGVVTVAAIVGMAAHISGYYASVLDVTGLAQKNGAVFSHIRFGADKSALMSARIPAGAADVILGFDLVAAAGDAGVGIMHRSRTKCFVNSLFTPSADFISDADGDFRIESMRKRLDMRSSELLLIDAGAIAERTLGDAIFANLLLLGAAWQSGAVPLSLDALDAAIQ